MPKRVRRMEKSPEIAPAAALERIEGRRHRNPLFAPGSPRLRTPEPAPRRAGALGGAGLNSTHDDTGAETHSLDTDLSKSRVGPISLDVGAVLAIESLDASPQECAHARPSLRYGPSHDRQPDRCVDPPHRS